jgi:ArsR family transcriptional regulator
MNAETLLDVLGNRTRREIIHLISEEPRCLTELSEETGVEKMAIMRHLEKMENAGMLHQEEKRMERGRPRKYYGIDTRAKLKVSVTPEDFEAKLQVSEVRESKFLPPEEDEFEKIKGLKDTDKKLKLFGELKDCLTKDIQRHEEAIAIDEDLLARIRKES